MRLLRLLCAFCLMAAPAFAQTAFDEPCPEPTTDRSINICSVPDGATVHNAIYLRAKVRDSLPVQVQTCLQACPDWGTTPDATKNVRWSVGAIGGTNQVDRFELIIRARDSEGEFQKSTWVYGRSNDICGKDFTHTPSIYICDPWPNVNTTVTSPVRVAAEANDPVPLRQMAIYVDGTKYSAASSRDDKLITWVLLNPGQHRITVWAINQNSQTYSKTMYVNVASTPPSP
jgi:hypothetical protein